MKFKQIPSLCSLYNNALQCRQKRKTERTFAERVSQVVTDGYLSLALAIGHDNSGLFDKLLSFDDRGVTAQFFIGCKVTFPDLSRCDFSLYPIEISIVDPEKVSVVS